MQNGPADLQKYRRLGTALSTVSSRALSEHTAPKLIQLTAVSNARNIISGVQRKVMKATTATA